MEHTENTDEMTEITDDADIPQEDQYTTDTDLLQKRLQDMINSDTPIVWERENKPGRIAASIKRDRQVRFLEVLSQIGVITKACKAVGINVATEARWRTDNDSWYMQQFKAAMQNYRDAIEVEIHERAINGVTVPIIGKVQTPLGAEDKIIGEKKVKSDLLLMFMAKRHIPEYRDKYVPPEETKAVETVSPMTRIVLNLNLMADRRNQTLNIGDNQGDNDNVIDITAQQKALPASTDEDTATID
jgi:hypothetical protein